MTVSLRQIAYNSDQESDDISDQEELRPGLVSCGTHGRNQAIEYFTTHICRGRPEGTKKSVVPSIIIPLYIFIRMPY